MAQKDLTNVPNIPHPMNPCQNCRLNYWLERVDIKEAFKLAKRLRKPLEETN
jgi:hypothetical protein